MTPAQRQQQMVNRVYGNIAIENHHVTRELVEHIVLLREMFKLFPLEQRFMRIGSELVSIPWPQEVLTVWDKHCRMETLTEHINLNVFLGILPGQRWPT